MVDIFNDEEDKRKKETENLRHGIPWICDFLIEMFLGMFLGTPSKSISSNVFGDTFQKHFLKCFWGHLPKASPQKH